MSKVEFKLDSKGVRAMLQSDMMLPVIEKYAQKKAGADTHIKTFVGFDRVKSIIYPNTENHK